MTEDRSRLGVVVESNASLSEDVVVELGLPDLIETNNKTREKKISARVVDLNDGKREGNGRRT